MIAVYFNPDFLSAFALDQQPIDETKLMHVANVDTDDLDRAWMLVQHGTVDWTTRPEVEVLPGLMRVGSRSLSVGDVLERDEQRYQIGVAGFYLLPSPGTL